VVAIGTYVTLLTINQSAGEGITKHDWIGMINWTQVDGNTIEGRTGQALVVDSYCGDLYFQDVWYASASNVNTQTPEWFPGAGLECTHEVKMMPSPNTTTEIWVSIVYERVPVMIE